MGGAVAGGSELPLGLVAVEPLGLEHLPDGEGAAAGMQPGRVDGHGHVPGREQQRRGGNGEDGVDHECHVPMEAGKDLGAADGDADRGDHPPAQWDIKAFPEERGVRGAVPGHDKQGCTQSVTVVLRAQGIEVVMAEGLLIIRLVVGGLLFAHGTQKLFGWYGGYGLEGTAGFFDSLGFRPGRQYAAIAGASEAGGGALLVLGLFTPLGAAMIIGTMIAAAVSVHAPQGLWATNGGYELPLVNGAVAAGLGFTGAGAWSIDNAANIPWSSGAGPGLTALLLAVIAFGITNMRRRQAIEATPQAAYPEEVLPADPAMADDDALIEETDAGRR